MKKQSRLLIILWVLICITLFPLESNALVNGNNEANQLLDSENIKIENIVQTLMEKGKIPGLSVVIVKGDKTIYQKGFGYADLENQKPVTSKTLFEIGSNSKAFTALGVLNLQKKEMIKLSESVSTYIPWLKMKYKGKNASVTIEELISHTSGISSATIDKIPVSNDDSALEETVKTLINTKLDNEPGKSFQYATINYDVLGLIIEKVSGVTYEKYMEENVIKPLGLNETYLNKDVVVDESMAQGYKIGFLKPRPYNAPIYRGNKPAGYIISNAADIAKWLKIQMGTYDNIEFSKALIEDSHKSKIQDVSTGSFYASGWYVRKKDDTVIYHPGANPNYSSFILYNPNKKIGVAVLSNMNSSYMSAVADGIYGIMIGKDYGYDVIDMYKSADFVSVLLIGILSFILLIILYQIWKNLKQILRKERKYYKKDKKNILGIVFSFIFIIVFSYCLNLIPYTYYGGPSWNFVFIWTPISLRIAIYLIFASYWFLYLYLLINRLYKKVEMHEEKSNIKQT